MKRATRSVLWAAALLVATPAGFPAAQTVAAANKSPRATGNKDPFVSGAPFTFEQVLRLAGEDAIPLHRRKEAIQNRGLDFSLTAEEVDKLKAAGVSDDLLKLIRSKAKPSTAAALPPPKPAPLGTLAVTCAPAECEITLNGTPLGSTKSGQMEMARLRPGKWVIDFKKNGFISRQSVVAVDADKTVPVSVVLDPDRATQEAFGVELFHQVVQAIGGEQGLKELASVQATGSATLWSRDGNSVRWTLLMRNNPDRALFQAKAGRILHEVAFLGSEFRASKNVKGDDALELPTDFGFIRDYQLAALIARLHAPRYKMQASRTKPSDGEEFGLFAEGGTEKISIGLDSELRPQRVRITTAAGVGSVLIIYTDYFKTERASYPKTIQIKPDGWQHGIEVRFDTVELNPNLNANDYKLKGKPFLNLGN